MNLRIAAIRSGSEPVRRLTSGSFQRWLETPLACPKCDATYNLAVDWDQSTDRWFPETSRPLITLLKKAIMMGHSTNHRVTHFETEGVIVESVTPTSTQETSATFNCPPADAEPHRHRAQELPRTNSGSSSSDSG
jgi:hypothetical protein